MPPKKNRRTRSPDEAEKGRPDNNAEANKQPFDDDSLIFRNDPNNSEHNKFTLDRLFKEKLNSGLGRLPDADWSELRAALSKRHANSPAWYIKVGEEEVGTDPEPGQPQGDVIRVQFVVIAETSEKSLSPRHYIIREHRAFADDEDCVPEKICSFLDHGWCWLEILGNDNENINAFLLVSQKEKDTLTSPPKNFGFGPSRSGTTWGGASSSSGESQNQNQNQNNPSQEKSSENNNNTSSSSSSTGFGNAFANISSAVPSTNNNNNNNNNNNQQQQEEKKQQDEPPKQEQEQKEKEENPAADSSASVGFVMSRSATGGFGFDAFATAKKDNNNNNNEQNSTSSATAAASGGFGSVAAFGTGGGRVASSGFGPVSGFGSNQNTNNNNSNNQDSQQQQKQSDSQRSVSFGFGSAAATTTSQNQNQNQNQNNNNAFSRAATGFGGGASSPSSSGSPSAASGTAMSGQPKASKEVDFLIFSNDSLKHMKANTKQGSRIVRKDIDLGEGKGKWKKLVMQNDLHDKVDKVVAESIDKRFVQVNERMQDLLKWRGDCPEVDPKLIEPLDSIQSRVLKEEKRESEDEYNALLAHKNTLLAELKRIVAIRKVEVDKEMEILEQAAKDLKAHKMLSRDDWRVLKFCPKNDVVKFRAHGKAGHLAGAGQKLDECHPPAWVRQNNFGNFMKRD